MIHNLEIIATLGASITLDYRPENYYSSKEKWSINIQLVSEGAGIRVETNAPTMAECIEKALEKFHLLRNKGFVEYSLTLPRPEAEPEAPLALEEEIPF